MRNTQSRLDTLVKQYAPWSSPSLDLGLIRRVWDYYEVLARRELPVDAQEKPVEVVGDLWECSRELWGRTQEVPPDINGTQLFNFGRAFGDIGIVIMDWLAEKEGAQERLQEIEAQIQAELTTETYREAWEAWCLLLDRMEELEHDISGDAEGDNEESAV